MAEIRKHRLKRSAAKYPSLKIEKGGNFQLSSISHILYRIKLPPVAKFPAFVSTYKRYIVITQLGAWGKLPDFQLGSISYLFQHTNLPLFEKFHAGITICTIV